MNTAPNMLCEFFSNLLTKEKKKKILSEKRRYENNKETAIFNKKHCHPGIDEQIDHKIQLWIHCMNAMQEQMRIQCRWHAYRPTHIYVTAYIVIRICM